MKQPPLSEGAFQKEQGVGEPDTGISAEKHKGADTFIRPAFAEDSSDGSHILGFGADLSVDHSGYYLTEYKRSYVADLAYKIHEVKAMKWVNPVLCVDYWQKRLEYGALCSTLLWTSTQPRLAACEEYLSFPQAFQLQVRPEITVARTLRPGEIITYPIFHYGISIFGNMNLVSGSPSGLHNS